MKNVLDVEAGLSSQSEDRLAPTSAGLVDELLVAVSKLESARVKIQNTVYIF